MATRRQPQYQQQQHQQQQQQQHQQQQRTKPTLHQNGIRPSTAGLVTSTLSKLTTSATLDTRTRFRILDVVLNCALLTPLAVLFQVSACGVQDVLFVKAVPGYVSTALLLAIGFAIEFNCSFWQKSLASIRYVSQRQSHDPGFVVVTRLYHFAIGFANVCHYRGLSDIYYYLIGSGSYGAIQTAATTVVLLSSLKCIRNILGPPLCVGVDASIENFFETGTLFRTKEDVYYKHFADHVSTVTVITSLCFLHWISVWDFFDCVIFPQNAVISVIFSWILGYAIIAVAFLVEPLAVKISRKLERREGRAAKLLFEDAFLVVCNTGVILVWRGHWIFFEGLMYYFPIYNGELDLTAFYGLFCSFLMMAMLHASATLILKGCDFDGELPEGKGVSFGIDYMSEFFKDYIAEKEEEQVRKVYLQESNSDLDQRYQNVLQKEKRT